MLTNRRLFAFVRQGVPTDVKCDGLDNVYVACGDGVEIYDRKGTLMGVIEVPGRSICTCPGSISAILTATMEAAFGASVSGGDLNCFYATASGYGVSPSREESDSGVMGRPQRDERRTGSMTGLLILIHTACGPLRASLTLSCSASSTPPCKVIVASLFLASPRLYRDQTSCKELSPASR
jgi:hypothetical protein